jgi:biopolymer transport protein ExbD
MAARDATSSGLVIPPERDEDHVIEHTTARQRHRRGRPTIALNLTAMIDVTFLLLVYFMVATQFKLGEEVYRLDLPDRSGSAPADPFDLDEEPLYVHVATTGPGLDAYRVRFDGPYAQPASFDELHAFLRERRISETTTGGLFESDHPIIIVPTRVTKWQHALEAFNAAARAHYTNVTLARPG